MSEKKYSFLSASLLTAFDRKHRQTIAYNIEKYETSVKAGKEKINYKRNYYSKAAFIKRQVLKSLAFYLEQFEKSALQNGIKILWAKDEEEARSHLSDIIFSNSVKKVVKSKSMTSEEVDFNNYFAQVGIDCIETDLGEFIVQNLGEKPYHILTPAMHKSLADIAKLFNRLFNLSESSSASDLTLFVREKLKNEFVTADMSLTGANFLLAKEGGIALIENEGNALFSISYPRVHVVLAGIDKILPSIDDLELFLPWLSLHGTGQKLTAYNSLIFGPRRANETDGPEKMYVILIDNGRSNLYCKPFQSEALSCIRCGACLNACPVYKTIGGHVYNSVYSGPIGSVITPHLESFSDNIHLSFASSLCGKCFEVCPVGIDLPKLLLINRKEAIDKRLPSKKENFIYLFFNKLLLKPGFIDIINKKIKSILIMLVGRRIIGERRSFPDLPNRSFRKRWKSIQKKNGN